MIRSRIAMIAASALLGLAVPVLATELPNVKLGLWEMTVSVQTNGQIPNIDMSKLSPAKQAMAQALMKSAMAKIGQPHAVKTCISEEQLKKGLSFNPNKDPSCTTTVLKSTANELQVKQVCTGSAGKPARTMDIDFTAPTPESVIGVSHVEAGGAGKGLAADGKISGKWLSDDCGKLKPGQMAKE
jgi:hypothetical protein